jgi:hypothetical protein
MARDPSLPPLPRDIQAQQVPPSSLLLGLAEGSVPQGAGPSAQSSSPAAGLGQNPVQLLRQKLSELERWASEMMDLLQNVLPSAQPLLVPIANAGKAIQSQIDKMEKRVAAGPGSQPVEGPRGIGQAPENPSEALPARPPR